MTTPQALLAAYVASSGLTVSMSYARETALTDLVNRGITPAEITELVKWMKKKIAQDRKGTYTPTSLEFRRLLDPDTAEERIISIRQEKTRSRPISAQTNHVIEVGSDKIVRLTDVQPPEPARIDVVNGLRGLASELERKKA